MATTTNDISSMEQTLLEQGRAAQAAARKLATLSAETKNQALVNIAHALESEQEPVLEANREDYHLAQADGMGDAMLDRCF